MLCRSSLVFALALVVGCAPTERINPPDNTNCPGADLQNDANNCGMCGHVCSATQVCASGQCGTSACTPGATADCYDGPSSTMGVGVCHGGQKTCSSTGFWGTCQGEITPGAEICGNLIDDNCSGVIDEDEDQDHDGFTTCQGDCCDNTAQCGQPGLVNPGAFDAPGNNVDDDCDGMADNGATALCDTGLASNSGNAMDYAKAMELCQTATETDHRWGVISAKWSLADGNGTPAHDSCSIRPAFGTNVVPKAGASLFEISTGNAADSNDTMPIHVAWESAPGMLTTSGFPADWLAANGGMLPNSPGCPLPNEGTGANDPVMLTLRIRVPTNAQSFSFSSNFFSSEYPEWVCTPFNDFFVVLLDSMWNGMPANPSDKNLATYTAPNMMKYPVGVNLVKDNTGLFNQCINGILGCSNFGGGPLGMSTTCQSTTELAGTGFDEAKPGSCDANSLVGGGTGWLLTSGNVKGGEIITLRIAIWDTSDHSFDSLAVVDNFQWAVTAADPGTNIP